MSAFVVSKSHIDALILLGLRLPYPSASPLRWSRIFNQWDSNTTGELTHETLHGVGQMLVDCCVASVTCRYQDSVHDGLPGPCDEYYKRRYRWEAVTVAPSAVQGLKLISCYEYQSCEHEGWKTSEAKSFCESLQGKLITELPGYDGADWEHTPEVKESESARLLKFSPGAKV
jgi:hypothetical protein